MTSREACIRAAHRGIGTDSTDVFGAPSGLPRRAARSLRLALLQIWLRGRRVRVPSLRSAGV